MVASGSLLVKSLVKISFFLRLREFVAAFVIMGVSTSIPELFVGISAAMAKSSAISLGNVIGSNIANLALIGGIAVLLARNIKCESGMIKRDTRLMFLIALVPMILMLIGNTLSRIDGAVLLIVFLFYMWRKIKFGRAYTKEIKERIGRWEIVSNVFIFIAGLVILFISAEYVIEYGSALAVEYLLPPIFIGIFFIALGTSLPELVFSVISVRTGHSEFLLGNLTGSVIANSTLILAVTSLIHPISANFLFFLSSAMFMVILCFLFMTFVESKERLDWREGIALIMFYTLFLIVELNLRGVF
ncbi:sodium:calcium antiporter [Candidatus Woesearchaeota archaeon]|nr:sodium:calcium antiporter [Candidatus Woesearchaeota archaeon]